ncbi:hypothetical protein P152DRAFT_158458 [Eremomyces bilateralis CBS 781.70]|uniref:Uncharacterized protein n=1 Tax=Eremomyces bilateralis CBS 781.70 TaxID=1392243 RepID=A0A6G1FUU8_9PEZI|nr:uncharacterized protein P152DRAFT_158458 [Eremomyces bilateralis CBS 781.70]KAF1809476.1 hypothetical protein P152DRAFT_158458 [Eremomyces bilateralis CBS 781.70]
MSLRNRLKRYVSRDSSTTTLPKSATTTTTTKPSRNPIIKLRAKSKRKSSLPSTPANPNDPDPNHVLYRPDESLPLPKYRRPVAKAHREQLENYDWATSWRRRSVLSEYSPGHSCASSRRGSRQEDTPVLVGIPRKSFQKARPLAEIVVDEPVCEELDVEAREGAVAVTAVDGDPQQQLPSLTRCEGKPRETPGDSVIDGMEGGRSDGIKTPSLVAEDSLDSRSTPTTLTQEEEMEARRILRTPQREAPFCVEELALALKRSQLASVG